VPDSVKANPIPAAGPLAEVVRDISRLGLFGASASASEALASAAPTVPLAGRQSLVALLLRDGVASAGDNTLSADQVPDQITVNEYLPGQGISGVHHLTKSKAWRNS
jgi:hypothetical protein